ncbi:MAG: extracellular solute-binding protein [Bosea sp. (in: a-proteobacteria)]|uniref:extracellular solute-binding protein n=1 Tax=Bosea sp. (in: a-proteobacteria) TaxID=1871050 RepID=UPI001DCF8F49|nr:extracellular solute-binding protein [Bosea sp. (in: a-proteobacteria)]MBX9875672.1 extracellular solute-binding protein [Beijerinckiaceae bacterium]MDP3603493.1 extracellular solute-binding protein [Bosea sp. (in: a-proteobacteria)]
MPTRRRLLQTGLATIAMPTVLRAQGLSGQITLMSYSGIFQDNYTKAVVEPFLAANPGVKVNYAPGGTSAQMVGSVRAQKADPQIDVVIMDVTTSSIGNIEGLFEKLTPAEFPVLEELAPEARAAGGEFGPAVTFDHLVLVYDTQNLKPPIAKLADLWRPDLKGQLALSAPPNIQGLALTAMVEKMEGGDHRKSIDAAMRKLKELAPSVNTFEPNPDGYSLILNGVVKVATGWNARSQLYGDQSNGRIGTLLPPEGSVFQINTINLTAGSKNRAVAAAFVKHALSQPAQKAFTERMFYAPTNAKAQIDPKAVARTAAAPESRASMIPVDWNDILKVRDQWNNRWRREVISAAR